MTDYVRCPGPGPDQGSEEEIEQVACEGTAEQYHAITGHAQCGCGNTADQCHPGRCCLDGATMPGGCRECGIHPPEHAEAEVNDGLFAAEAAP